METTIMCCIGIIESPALIRKVWDSDEEGCDLKAEVDGQSLHD